jgi:hypothetical protein
MGRKKAKNYALHRINGLLDYLLITYKIKNDTALCRLLEVPKCNLSKARHGVNAFGDSWILAIHEVFEIPIKEIKEMLDGER